MIQLNRSIGIYALIIMLMFGCFAITGAMAALSTGLVSWWDFEKGSGKDSGPGGNDGTAVGGPKVGEGYGVGDGLWFNGADQYVTVPDSSSLQIPGDITVAGWMNVTKGNNHAAICWKGQGVGWGPLFSWRVATTADTNMTWGRTDGNGTGSAMTGDRVLSTTGAELWFATDNVITTSKWIHVALTSSATDGMRAYVDGADVTSKTGQADNAAKKGPFGTFPGSPVEIGVGRRIGGTDGNDFYFDGGLDKIGIWNRTLSAAEVAELAAGGSPTPTTAVEAKDKLSTTWGKIKGIR